MAWLSRDVYSFASGGSPRGKPVGPPRADKWSFTVIVSPHRALGRPWPYRYTYTDKVLLHFLWLFRIRVRATEKFLSPSLFFSGTDGFLSQDEFKNEHQITVWFEPPVWFLFLNLLASFYRIDLTKRRNLKFELDNNDYSDWQGIEGIELRAVI